MLWDNVRFCALSWCKGNSNVIVEPLVEWRSVVNYVNCNFSVRQAVSERVTTFRMQ